MHNLKTNFNKFSQLLNTFLADRLLPDGNFRSYPNAPKLCDRDILALTLCAEALSIDSESYFWSKLCSDHADDFNHLIDRSNFNRRKRSLAPYLILYNERIAAQLNEGEDAYIVDSMPVPICNIARASRCRICREATESSPDKGYSAVTKSYFFGYKLHLVTSVRGVTHSFQLSPASTHDLHYLEEIKDSRRLNNCVLIGDKGYISREQQTDLFHTARVELAVPSRSNQKGVAPYTYIFKRCRKRIETQFSQLCDQFVMKRNYAKTFNGLCTRIISKIAAFTSLQYLNTLNNRPLNHIKHALAA
jgi:hypothetical protein